MMRTRFISAAAALLGACSPANIDAHSVSDAATPFTDGADGQSHGAGSLGGDRQEPLGPADQGSAMAPTAPDAQGNVAAGQPAAAEAGGASTAEGAPTGPTADGTPALPVAAPSADADIAPADMDMDMDMDSAGDGALAEAAIPAPVETPFVWGLGLGVSDMEAAVGFYTDVMKMTVEKADVVRKDRVETVLWAKEANRGSRLVLMKYNDGRETRKITTKLVWQASSPSQVNRDAASHPDYESRLNFGIVQFDGPDTYIQEVGSIFDSGSEADTPYLVAMGFSVSDLAASRTFYMEAFGMTESYTGAFPVTDANGSGNITEYTVTYSTGGGAGLVLQDWSPERNSKDNPVKVVLQVPDAQEAADAVVAAGGTIAEPAERSAAYDNRLLIVTKDLDGYEIELVQ